MALEEGVSVGSENSESGGNDKIREDANLPASIGRDLSFSRWSQELATRSRSETPNNLLKNGRHNGELELPTLRDGAESQEDILDGDEKSLVKIHPLENRSNSFRHRSIHANEGHGGIDSINRDDAGSPRNHEDATGNGKKISSVYVEHENSGKSGSPRLWGSPRERSVRNLEIGNSDLSFNESSQMNQNFISAAMLLRTLFFIFVWYSFSTCLTLYNKSLLGDQLGKFPAPMLMSTVHFAMQTVLAKVILCFWSQRFEPTGVMSWRDYFTRVVPTALGTAVDINLSNASLVSISVTFATMCKSASPVFLLLFAFAFKLEAPSLKLLGIMFIISSGVLLTVAKETEFQFWGFVLVMLAAVMSGFRWTMTQILLQFSAFATIVKFHNSKRESYGLKNPINFMSSVSPVMALVTALLSFLFDPWVHFKQNVYFHDSSHIFRSCLLMAIGGGLAFFMVLTEYILVSATSAVTVTIAGVVKEAVTIVVAVFYFHDEFTLIKGVGLFTIMVGVSLFNWYKYQKLQKGFNESGEFIGSPHDKGSAKYVILDSMDDIDEEA